MTWLLKLYPSEWRRRYGVEVEELVASQPRSLQLFIDLLGGAVDAHLKPQVLAPQLDQAGAADRGESKMLKYRNCCGTTANTSRTEALFGAGLTIGFALVVAAIMLIGNNPITETIGMTMFPGVLAVGVLSTRVRGHSLPAKVALIGGPLLLLFLIGLAAGLVQNA